MVKDVMRILMIGPIPPPIGGISVSFKMLVDLLEHRDNIIIEVINYNSIHFCKRESIFDLLFLLKVIISKAKSVDVITVYFASTALPSLGLVLLVISRILGKPIIVRKAGGVDYMSFGFLKGGLAHLVVKHSDLYLAQTKRLVQLARRRDISKVKWYPTNRPMKRLEKLDLIKEKSCKRFVFVGHINEFKGIKEIIDVDKLLPDSISIDVFGPFTGHISENDFDNCKNVHYKGILNPQKVINSLAKYDALLLPTYHAGEGYPGVIIEAYAAGLPVISTHWLEIPEIVDESSGILIPPRDVNALFNAMKKMSKNFATYKNYKKGVYKKRKEFDLVIWADQFLEYCRFVCNDKLFSYKIR